MRLFHISDILSIVPGRLVSTRHMDGIYDILNFMTERDIDDSLTALRLEKIDAAERKLKLGAGLVNVIREMPADQMADRLLRSKRFRDDMRVFGHAGVCVGPDETIEEALEDAQKQSQVRGDCLGMAVGQLVESERIRKDQASIIRKERASKHRQLVIGIGLILAAGLIGFALGLWLGR